MKKQCKLWQANQGKGFQGCFGNFKLSSIITNINYINNHILQNKGKKIGKTYCTLAKVSTKRQAM